MTQKIGIGIDIVDVSRFRKKAIRKNLSFYRKILSESEIKYCTKFKSPYEHFAGKFAVKGAIIKTFSQSSVDFGGFFDIEIYQYETDNPQ